MAAVSLNLPPTHGPARDAAILAYIHQGHGEVSWAPLVVSGNGHVVSLWVFADALKIGGVRINVSAALEQQIADLYGCSLLTAKLADLLWENRVATLAPSPVAITSSTDGMIKHSQRVDKMVPADYQSGILATVGKHWVIDNDLQAKVVGTAMNYGWHFVGATHQGIKGEVTVSGTSRLIQGRGTAHDKTHVDYSQICQLVAHEAYLDGAPVPLSEVFAHPTASSLINHSGVLRVLRQPGVTPVLSARSPYTLAATSSPGPSVG